MVKNQVRKALSFYTDVGGANVDSVDYYIGNYVIATTIVYISRIRSLFSPRKAT